MLIRWRWGGGGLGGAIFLALETSCCWIGGAGGGFVGLPRVISAMQHVDYLAIRQRRKIDICVPWIYAPRQRRYTVIYTVQLPWACVGSNPPANQSFPFVLAALHDYRAIVVVQLGNFPSIF